MSPGPRAVPAGASGAGLLEDVLRLASAGNDVPQVAALLGIPRDLAETVLDHAVRLGLAEPAGGPRAGSPGCAACPAGSVQTGERRLPLSCAGCPLARRT